MKKYIRILTLFLSLAMVFSFGVGAMDMMGPPPGGGGPGGPGGPPGGGAPENAAIVIADGAEDPSREYEAGAYAGLITQQNGETVIEGLEIVNGDYTFNGLVVTGADSVVRLKKANIRLGVDSPAASDMVGGAATNIDGATIYISDSNIIVDGSARYVVAAYNSGTMVVNNSYIESTGKTENTLEIAEPFSNEALLISGDARANFSIGATDTYYFNSSCVAEGWAALSTDSAMGDGLDLYAYNTDGIAVNGGYSTYADTNCRVWLYGSRMSAAEIGCIISKSGQIHVQDSTAAGEEIMQYNEGDTVDVASSVMGGRNAVMIHAPDMMGMGLWAADCGTYVQEGGLMATTRELVSAKDYNDYGEAVGAYIDHVSGSVFLIRSTSANIDLKAVEMESYNNTLVHTVLNADSMGNFLASGDGAQVNPVAVNMTDMDVTGDILHEDYHRNMTVNLSNTTLTGNIIGGSMASWNAQWAQYGEVNWVVDESYEAECGVSLTMGKDARWNVTGASNLTALTLEDGAVIQGEITLDGVALVPEAGVTYTGDIRISGNYVPEEPETPSQEPAEEPETQPEESAAPAEEPQPSSTPGPAESPYEKPQEDEYVPRRPETPVAVYVAIAAAVVIVAGMLLLLKKNKKG